MGVSGTVGANKSNKGSATLAGCACVCVFGRIQFGIQFMRRKLAEGDTKANQRDQCLQWPHSYTTFSVSVRFRPFSWQASGRHLVVWVLGCCVGWFAVRCGEQQGNVVCSLVGPTSKESTPGAKQTSTGNNSECPSASTMTHSINSICVMQTIHNQFTLTHW